MKLKITVFSGFIICMLCLMQSVNGQTYQYRLIASSSYLIYIDSFGDELRLPKDSVHYGYATNEESVIEAFRNTQSDLQVFDTMAIGAKQYDTLERFSADSFSWVMTEKRVNLFDSKRELEKSIQQEWWGWGENIHEYPLYREDTTINKYENGLLKEKQSSDAIHRRKTISKELYWYNKNGKQVERTLKPDDTLIEEELMQYDDKGREISSFFYRYNTPENGNPCYDTSYMRYEDSDGYNLVYSAGREINDDVNRRFLRRELFRYIGEDLVLYQYAIGYSKSDELELPQLESPQWRVMQFDTIIYENHKVTKYLSKLGSGTRNLKKLYWSYNENGLPIRYSLTTTRPGDGELYFFRNGKVYLPNKIRPAKVRSETFYYYQEYVQAKH